MRTAHLDDEQLEAWFRLHRDRIADVRTGALRRVAPWLPIIDLPANDNLSGGDD